MIEIKKYSNKRKEEWDNFIRGSKNGVFFFLRDYVEYHSHRFTDSSLMFYKDGKLRAVLPANINDDVLISHGGLSFGGLILDTKATIILVISLFDELRKFAASNRIKEIIYKSVPYIYHIHPADEDLYAMYLLGAKIIKRNPSTVIRMRDKINFQTLRKRSIKKAINNKLVVDVSSDYNSFWDILIDNLRNKYNINPVHSIEEIKYLVTKFPANIKLFVSSKDKQIIAGVVLYENKSVVRAQYIAASPHGKKIGAIDIIFDYLIKKYSSIDYFDFGVSTETIKVDGKYLLNEGLVFQKEGFGGRTVVYDTYKITI